MTGTLLKVEGAGNDFVLGTGTWAERLTEEPDLVFRLCQRRRGIGADGALAVLVTGQAAVRLHYRNGDGSQAAFCANATRCAARVAVELLGLGPAIEVTTSWAVIPAEVRGPQVTLVLPPPPAASLRFELDAAGRRWQGWLLEVGVPHLVIPAGELDSLDLGRVGPELRRHPELGADGANVSFVERTGVDTAAVRTWERGVEGETLACGSGIVAAALVAMARGSDDPRRLHCRSRSGDLLVVEASGRPPLCPSRLTGPTRIVAEIRPCDELLGLGRGAR